jgi:phosphoglucosamine mutase
VAGVPKLFGTDGVRGHVGDLITAELALRVGRAAASALTAERPRVLIVRDTRESGPMLESALAAGIASVGGDVYLGGILPTPAAPILSASYGFDLSVAVSASHNPFADNGIKLFGRDGGKLDDDTEALVERLVAEPPEEARHPGSTSELRGAEGDYLRHLTESFRLDLSGHRIALDCANGSTFRVAPEVFVRLGAEVVAYADEPDGRNINAECGSTHTDFLASKMSESGCSIGFSFDGDGDRVLALDRAGKVHDGDELIALIATGLAGEGSLGGGVSVTVMSNYGFHQAMDEAGIAVDVTQVGDRYVYESLVRNGWQLGGEQSGHIIARQFAPTGDGIAAALMVLGALEGRDLSQAAVMEKLPQELVNVAVPDRDAVMNSAPVTEAIHEAEQELDGRGRILVRPSGTEPLIRIMVEAPTGEEAEQICARLAGLVENEVGS